MKKLFTYLLLIAIGVLLFYVKSAFAQSAQSNNFTLASDKFVFGASKGDSNTFTLYGNTDELVGLVFSNNFTQTATTVDVPTLTPTPAPTATTSTSNSSSITTTTTSSAATPTPTTTTIAQAPDTGGAPTTASPKEQTPPLFDIVVGPGPSESKKVNASIFAIIATAAALIVIYIFKRRKKRTDET